MPKRNNLPLLLSLAAVALVSACNPIYSVLEDLRPAKDLCTDMGDGTCKTPNPDDLKAP